MQLLWALSSPNCPSIETRLVQALQGLALRVEGIPASGLAAFQVVLAFDPAQLEVRDPNGTLAKVLSYIPPFTPFVMMNRAAGPPETWEYAVTTVLLVASIAAAFWAAAKIFRVGILMTGKPPKLGELWRWVRMD